MLGVAGHKEEIVEEETFKKKRDIQTGSQKA